MGSSTNGSDSPQTGAVPDEKGLCWRCFAGDPLIGRQIGLLVRSGGGGLWQAEAG